MSDRHVQAVRRLRALWSRREAHHDALTAIRTGWPELFHALVELDKAGDLDPDAPSVTESGVKRVFDATGEAMLRSTMLSAEWEAACRFVLAAGLTETQAIQFLRNTAVLMAADGVPDRCSFTDWFSYAVDWRDHVTAVR